MNSTNPPRFLSYWGVLALLLLLLSLPATSRAQGETPELPFRATRDGSVNFHDLMKLTRRPASRDRISDEELEAIKKEHQIDYGKKFIPTDGPKMPPRNDLYANSVLLSDGSYHTLLPKRALLHVPEALQGRVVEEPEGRLLLWPDFLKRNRNWLVGQEVTFETAKGEQPFSQEEMDIFRRNNLVVVAVLRGSPISVLPPKIEEKKTISLTDAGEEAGSLEPGDGASPAEDGTMKPGPSRRPTRKEAAESLAQVESEARAMADENEEEAEASKGSGSTSPFKERSKALFGRLRR